MSLWISIEMLYTACIEGAGSSDDAMNLLTYIHKDKHYHHK